MTDRPSNLKIRFISYYWGPLVDCVNRKDVTDCSGVQINLPPRKEKKKVACQVILKQHKNVCIFIIKAEHCKELQDQDRN